MKRIIILIIMLLLSITSAQALDLLCSDTPEPNVTCSVVTPTLTNCAAYNYSVYDENENLLINNTLTPFSSNTNIYYFNYTFENEGEYLSILCDGSTRRFYVEAESDIMAWIAIIISLGIMTVMFGYISFKIQDRNLYWAKILTFLLSVLNVFLLGLMPYLITINPNNVESFAPVAFGYLAVNGGLLVYFVWMFGAYLFLNVFKDQTSKKEDSNNYDKM